MTNLIHALNNKKFRYGAFSTLTAIVVLAVLIIVNLIFFSLNLSYDVSKNKAYSISQYSIDIIKKYKTPYIFMFLQNLGVKILILKILSLIIQNITVTFRLL